MTLNDLQHRIKTQNIQPPIPIRSFDWVAWLDGHEEDGPYGYGPTQDDALADLHMNMELHFDLDD